METNSFMKNLIAALFLIFFTCGCAFQCSQTRQDQSPEQVLEKYLDLAFNISKVEQKKLLLEYTYGPLKAAIASATDETFHDAYIKNKYKLEGFSIISKKERTPRETEITYQLDYKEFSDPAIKDGVFISTKNTIILVKENKKWYVKEVSGSKTQIEFPIYPQDTILPSTSEQNN